MKKNAISHRSQDFLSLTMCIEYIINKFFLILNNVRYISPFSLRNGSRRKFKLNEKQKSKKANFQVLIPRIHLSECYLLNFAPRNLFYNVLILIVYNI